MGENATNKLGGLDRLLTVWIFLAMGLGLIIGSACPSIQGFVSQFQVGSISIPIAIGLIFMMYPPFVKVNYDKISPAFGKKRLLVR